MMIANYTKLDFLFLFFQTLSQNRSTENQNLQLCKRNQKIPELTDSTFLPASVNEDMPKSKLLGHIYKQCLLICQREMQVIQNLLWRDKKDANPKLDEPTIIEHLQTERKEFDHVVYIGSAE